MSEEGGENVSPVHVCVVVVLPTFVLGLWMGCKHVRWLAHCAVFVFVS